MNAGARKTGWFRAVPHSRPARDGQMQGLGPCPKTNQHRTDYWDNAYQRQPYRLASWTPRAQVAHGLHENGKKCTCKRSDVVRAAVGTTITDRPPHRAVRAQLTHTAPAADIWRRFAPPERDTRARVVAASGCTIERPAPRSAAPLAAQFQCEEPVVAQPFPAAVQARRADRNLLKRGWPIRAV